MSDILKQAKEVIEARTAFQRQLMRDDAPYADVRPFLLLGSIADELFAVVEAADALWKDENLGNTERPGALIRDLSLQFIYLKNKLDEVLGDD